MECVGCPFNGRCPCGYSCNNAACLTLRKWYAEAMTAKSDALYDKSMQSNDVKQEGVS